MTILQRIKVIASDRMVNAGLLMISSSFIGQLAAYFFQFAMARMLTPKEFGEINSLLSLLCLAIVPTGVASLVIVRFVSRFYTLKEIGKLRLFIQNSLRILLGAGLAVMVVGIFARSKLQEFLRLDHVMPVMIIFLVVFLSFLIPVAHGFLQGLQRFFRLGVITSAGGLIRLISGVVLVSFGFGVSGALFAGLLALLPLLGAIKPYREAVRCDDVSGPVEKHTKEILSFSVPVTWVLIGTTGLIFSDLILVKHFFEPDLAGQYSTAVVLGRAIYYLPATLALAMFPMVSEAHDLNQETIHLLKKSLWICGGLALSGVFIFWAIQSLMIQVLFGKSYASSAWMLPWYGSAMAAAALWNICVQFNLALKRYHFIYILYAGLILEVLLTCFFHDSLSKILLWVNVTQWSIFICVSWVSFKRRG